MSAVYDIILAVIFILTIRRGWRRGVLATILVLLGWAVAAFLIAAYSGGWAESFYTRFVEQAVIRKVERAIPAGAVTAMNSGADALQGIQGVLDGLGGILGGRSVSIGDVSAIESALRQDGSNLAQLITQTVFKPVLTAFLQSVISILILVVTLAVLRMLARGSSRRHRGVLGRANQFFGAALGALEGWVIGFVYALSLSLLSELLTVDWLTPQILQSTSIVSRFLS